MIRPPLFSVLVLSAALGAQPAQADPPSGTLVLPLRSIGVSDTTIFVSRDLLIESLQDLGVQLSGAAPAEAPLPGGREACADADCAAALGRQHGASQVIYGSLSRLGGKIIARLNVLRVNETAPYYRDQLTATSEEDLDQVMRRFAEGIASGRPNSDRASVGSVTQAETMTPARRASRAGFGLRAGFLFPTGNSFGGADRLTNFHAVYKYELHEFQLETTTLLGFTWGDGNYDWTIFDLSATRIFGTKDFTPYLGAGIGVHSVTVERQQNTYVVFPPYPPYYLSGRQSKTAPSVDLVAGFIALRTYDFEAVLEIRYHYIFEKFDQVGGNGANGVLVSIGTSR